MVNLYPVLNIDRKKAIQLRMALNTIISMVPKVGLEPTRP